MTYFRRRIERDAVNVSGVRHFWVAILVPLLLATQAMGQKLYRPDETSR